MRTIVVILVLLAVATCLSAQEEEVEISLPLTTGQKAILNLRFAEKIEVKTWDKKELLIKANVSINGGLLNDAHTIDTLIRDNAIEISTDFDKDIIKNSGFRECTGQHRTQYKVDNRGDQHYSICHNISYIVFLPPETDLEVETISGNISLSQMTSEVSA
ncbi:MAG TPA: hypothetical protein VFZ52_04690, partial [Chryseolinea sp.]